MIYALGDVPAATGADCVRAPRFRANGTCADRVASANNLAGISLATAITGGVLLAAGGVLFALGVGGTSSTSSHLAWAPILSPTAVGLVFGGAL